jgi:hypothetical protein
MGNVDQRDSLLRQLHVLNRCFIELICKHDLPGCDFLEELRALDAAAVHELCAMPFTLYELPFANDAFWRQYARVPASVQRTAWFAVGSDKAREIAAMTLILAWHAVHKDPASARLFFGMSQGTFETLHAADVATLTAMIEPAAEELRPRWPSNPHFWPDLVRCAGADPLRMQGTRLLGSQLLAAEQFGERLTPQPRRKTLDARIRTREAAGSTAASDPPPTQALIQPV